MIDQEDSSFGTHPPVCPTGWWRIPKPQTAAHALHDCEIKLLSSSAEQALAVRSSPQLLTFLLLVGGVDAAHPCAGMFAGTGRLAGTCVLLSRKEREVTALREEAFDVLQGEARLRRLLRHCSSSVLLPQCAPATMSSVHRWRSASVSWPICAPSSASCRCQPAQLPGLSLRYSMARVASARLPTFSPTLASAAAALPRGSPLCQLLPCGPAGCRLLSGSTSRC